MSKAKAKLFWAAKLGLGDFVLVDDQPCEWYPVVNGYGAVGEEGRGFWPTKQDALAVARRFMEKEINDRITKNGGWTKEQLAAWGVPWPPQSGWKQEILNG